MRKAGLITLNLSSKLRDQYDQWWYFPKRPEVPPDNNLTEDSLRFAIFLGKSFRPTGCVCE